MYKEELLFGGRWVGGGGRDGGRRTRHRYGQKKAVLEIGVFKWDVYVSPFELEATDLNFALLLRDRT